MAECVLSKDPRASGTVYGTHYAIRFTHKQMVPTPVLFAETPCDNAQVEQRDHNLFASRSSLTPAAATQSQGQAERSAGGDIHRATGILLKDPCKVRKAVVEGQVNSSTDPVESPNKEQPMATPSNAEVGETNANLRA